jgi:4-diphosphocytidyl-2-C-methyl-D-erythritol kinase
MVKIRTIRSKAPGKINLHLGVGKVRADGFHELQSIFARISLFDDILITIYEGEVGEILVQGLEASNIKGEDTLTKAARLWCDATAFNSKIVIKVKKNIPSEAGLGGGSSDAAAVLLSLQKLNSSIALSFDKLLDLGAKVGSDVPFFLYEETFCYVSGRGEFVIPISGVAFDYKIHLIKPLHGESTKGAFLKLDKIDRDEFYSRDEFILIFKSGLLNWKDCFINDFERVIESDVLTHLKKSNNFCLMSGSGSTCYEVLDKESVTTRFNDEIELNDMFGFY